MYGGLFSKACRVQMGANELAMEKKNQPFPRSKRVTKDLSSLAKVLEEMHELNNDPAECVTQLQEERWGDSQVSPRLSFLEHDEFLSL